MQLRAALSIASVGVIFLTVEPVRADGMQSLKDTPVVVTTPSWGGYYFGGSIGYGRNRSKNNYSDTDGLSSSVAEEAEGGLISAIWGFDRVIRDRFVIGGFVDVDWSDIDRGYEGNEMTIDRSINIGARIGYLISDRTMLFATAGYSRAHFDNGGWWDIETFGPTLQGKNSVDFNGYFIGAGFESRLRGNFFLRGEGRYAKYSEEVTNTGTFFGTTYVDKEDPEIWSGRIGLVYKIGRGEGPLAEGEHAPDTLKVASYSGVDVSRDAWAIYSGKVFALNGDFTRSGFVARSQGVYAQYHYDIGAPPTSVDAKDRSIDAMIGYNHTIAGFSAIVYAGLEIRDVDLSPEDLSNDVRGTKTGFKLALEIENEAGPLYYSLDASYSTAFDSIFALARIGHNRAGYIFGPEAYYFSDEGDWAVRAGGFAKIPFSVRGIPSELTIHGGYQWVEDEGTALNGGVRAGGEGAYGGTMVKFIF